MKQQQKQQETIIPADKVRIGDLVGKWVRDGQSGRQGALLRIVALPGNYARWYGVISDSDGREFYAETAHIVRHDTTK